MSQGAAKCWNQAVLAKLCTGHVTVEPSREFSEKETKSCKKNPSENSISKEENNIIWDFFFLWLPGSLKIKKHVKNGAYKKSGWLFFFFP